MSENAVSRALRRPNGGSGISMQTENALGKDPDLDASLRAPVAPQAATPSRPSTKVYAPKQYNSQAEADAVLAKQRQDADAAQQRARVTQRLRKRPQNMPFQ